MGSVAFQRKGGCSMANDARDEFVLVASQDGRIQALDAHDGRARWTQNRGHPFAGLALAQVGREVVAVSLDGYVCKLALDDGALRWERSLPIAGPLPSPTSGIRIAANHGSSRSSSARSSSRLLLDDGHTSWEARPTPAAHQWWLLAAGAGHIYTLQIERFARASRRRVGSVAAGPAERAAESACPASGRFHHHGIL